MKKLSYLMSMACIALFASCSSDTEEFVQENKAPQGKYTIGVSMPGADDTRVYFDNNVITSMVWSQGDYIQLRAEDPGNPNMPIKMEYWTLQTGAGSPNATFTGNIPQGGDWMNTVPLDPSNACYFLYAGVHDMSPWNTDLKYNQQEQSAFNVAEVGKYVIMESAKTTIADVQAGKSVKLVPTNALIKLNVKSMPEIIKNSESFTFSFYTNYAQGASPIAKTTVKAALDQTADANYVYFAFDPVANPELKANEKIAFDITCGANTVHVDAISKLGKKYEAGKIYTITLDYANDSNDEWNWVIPEPVFFEKVFDDLKDWTVINTSTVTNTAGWGVASLWNPAGGPNLNVAQGWLMTSYEDVVGDHFMISPVITLKASSNAVEFHHATAQLTEEQKPICLKLLIRTVEGTVNGEWVEIPGITYNKGQQWNAEFTSSGELPLTGYEGKNVQFAFKYNLGTNGTLTWNIRDFMLRGH